MIPRNDIQKALEFVHTEIRQKPKLAIVLGSGLADFGTKVKAVSTLHSSQIPGYPNSSVQGHPGKLIFGFLQKGNRRSVPLLVFQGRVHYYETESLEQVTFPIILAYNLGVRKLILTNAAGGINTSFAAGDLMLIEDVLQLSSLPLSVRGRALSSLSEKGASAFDAGMQRIALRCAAEIGIAIRQGTYCWLKGPSYETAAEIEMLRCVGADAVGMSTVPEVVAARHLGMKTVGISLISNLAAGLSATKLSHAEVTETANQAQSKFTALMLKLIFSVG